MSEDDKFTAIFVKALSERLKEDQGVIVHHDGFGYIVYKNTANKTMGIQEDKQFLLYPHGSLVTTGVSQQMADMKVEAVEEEEEDEASPMGNPVKVMKN